MPEITIPNLIPDTNYVMSLRATAGEETSEWSNIFIFRTAGDTSRPSAPVDFKVDIQGRDFALSWKRPTTNENGTVLRDLSHYKIVIKPTGSTTQEYVTSTNNLSFLFDYWTNFIAFGAFKASLDFYAYSVDHSGNVSEFPAFVSKTKAPPGAPTNLVWKTNGTSFVATWSAPTVNADDIQDYKIVLTYTPATGSPTVTTFWSSETTWEFTEAMNRSTYFAYRTPLKIEVWTRDNAEQLSTTSVTATTGKARPAKPLNPAWILDGSTFTGTWDAVTTDMDGNTLADGVGYMVRLTAGADSHQFHVTDNKFVFTKEQNISIFRTLRPTIFFEVAARDSVHQLSDWTTAIERGNPKPAPPTGLTATGLVDSIRVTWTAPADTDIVAYDIYIASTPTGEGTFATRVAAPSTSYVHQTVAYGTAHYVYMRAIDDFGTPSDESARSNNVTPTSPFTVDTVAPEQTTGVTVTTPTGRAAAQSAAILVSWTQTAVADLAGFQLRYSTNVTPRVWQYQDVVDKDARSILIEGLSSNTVYVVQMRPYDTMINTPTGWTTEATGTSTTSTAPPQNISSSISILTGGSLRSADYVESTTDTPGMGWLLSPSLLNIEKGKVNAAVISAGELRSRNNITDATKGTVGQPLWSLNIGGNMSINDAQVRGKIVVGSGSDTAAQQSNIAISSHTYGGAGAQWAIKGDGTFDIKSGTGARVQLSSSGLTGHNGTKETFSLTSAGTLKVDGEVNAGSGSFYGDININGAGHLNLQGSDAYIHLAKSGGTSTQWLKIDGRTTTDTAIVTGNDKFKVTYDGALTATDANITGTVNASGGAIAGFTISPTLGLHAGSGTTRVQMQPGVGFWTSSDNRDNAAWYVRQDGYMKATYGTIGGWTINGTTITAGSATLNSNGSMSIGSNFSVNTAGTVTAYGGTFTGNITANAVASNTTITSPTINSGTITGGTIQTGSSGTWVRMIESSADALQFVNSGSVTAEIRGTMPNGSRGIYLNVDTAIGNTQSIMYQYAKRKAHGGAPSDVRVRAGSFSITGAGSANIGWDSMSPNVPNCVLIQLDTAGARSNGYTTWVTNVSSTGCTLHWRYNDDGATPGSGGISGYYYAEVFV